MILEKQRNKDTNYAACSGSWVLQGTFSREAGPKTVPVTSSPFRIGRAPQVDLYIPSAVVSSHHAEICESAGLLILRDTGSTNGTFVNGKKIAGDHLIAEGDLVEIGDAFFRILPSSPEPVTPSVASLAGKTQHLSIDRNLLGPRSLQKLLRDGQLLPCFQAIHCLSTRVVRGYEYLARSSYPGIETAGQLFEQARLAGREVELSMLCRQKAMEFSVGIKPECPVFLNTHPQEPMLEVVVPQLRVLRGQYPERPIVLEIHEAAITEPSQVRHLRSELSKFGVQLAFDDFGKGQNRIRELICAPCDYIKFDPSLIHDLQQVSADQFRFFRSIIEGIKSEGAMTIAEGIETVEMEAVCRNIGFDLVQGYLFSRPALLRPECG